MWIPVSVIIATKNEEHRIEKCLKPLQNFSEVIVVDSNSEDNTKEISKNNGASVFNFSWNGSYPKKRQWILENIKTKNDFIFFVDADEILFEEFIEEISHLDFSADGYFISGQYIWNGKNLKFGMRNKKICLFHRDYFFYPNVHDDNAPGMGEIEGHFQPRAKHRNAKIKTLRTPLVHDAQEGWHDRHVRYAAWENYMNRAKIWPRDPLFFREFIKRALRANPLRPEIMFVHSYIIKLGFLDGAPGFSFAYHRWRYYQMIRALSFSNKVQDISNAKEVPKTAP